MPAHLTAEPGQYNFILIKDNFQEQKFFYPQLPVFPGKHILLCNKILFIQRWLGPRLFQFLNKESIKKYIITLFSCIAVLFINPYGIEYVKFLLYAATMDRTFITESFKHTNK